MFEISHLPERSTRPRTNGLTMVMDKGLSLRQAEDLIETGGELVDLLKLGFGTSLVTPKVGAKVKRYHEAGFDVYCGGTLFEAFYIRNELDNYLRFIDSLGITCLEVSDGSMVIPHNEKCELINKLSKNYKVLSEVGSKEEGILISPAKWIRMMSNELQAGSFKVIAEARESGNVGIYRPNGSAHVQLVRRILANVAWKTSSGKHRKSPNRWFLRQFGANVNPGNIGPNDLIPLECLRLGLRGDTFFEHLPDALAEGKRLVNDTVEED